MNNYIEAWSANNAERAIQHNFYASFSSNGIITNTDCAFIGTFIGSNDSNNMHTCPDLMITLNHKLKVLRSRGFYSFSSVLYSVVDVSEKYKIGSTDCHGEASERDDEEEEDGGSSDGEGYTMALGSTRSSFGLNGGQQRNGYFDELIEDANKRCDGARSVGIPASENIKNDILRWCKVYSSSHSKWCVGFEIELTGILSEYSRHRHGHLYQALGFSFSTPLVIEVTFHPLRNNLESRSLEAQGVSLSEAFQGLSAMHTDLEFKVPPMESTKFVYSDGQEDLDKELAKLIDLSQTNPMYLYGLRTLLPRIAKDFFTRGGRNKDPNVLLAGEENIFVRFLLFTGSHLASLLKRCIVCDKELPFTVSRLCSCADELCLVGFEVLGLGAQVLQEMVRMPEELIDLEISLAFAAANASKRDVFEPFPPFLLEKGENPQRSEVLNGNHIDNRSNNPNPRFMSQSGNKYKNMDALSSIIDSFPPASNMKLWAGKEECQLRYNVLSFILCTNRPSLVFLSDDDDKLIKPGNSSRLRWQLYQFAVVQDSPEREVAYTSKNKHEVSRFGFHGSPRENWYSILRNGLRCLSNTNLMSNGDAMGDGIYLADSFQCSAKYALPSSDENKHGWFNSRFKDGCFYVVGICEAVSSPSIKEKPAVFSETSYKIGKIQRRLQERLKIREKSGIYFVPKESEGTVVVRYLLVCYSSSTAEVTANISDGHILSQGGHSVDLSQHHRNIRRKYASISSSD